MTFSLGLPIPTASLLAGGELPFEVAHARLDLQALCSDEARADALAEVYRALLDRVGLLRHGQGGDRCGPYNLLVTCDWMVVVPRAREAWNGISVNAMGFAGALLVGDRGDLVRLQEYGLLQALSRVGWTNRPGH